MNLCTTNPAYDTTDALNLRFAIDCAKRALGAEIQKRGFLLDVTVIGQPGVLHTEYAGELAAAELDLTARQLADYRDWTIQEWADAWMIRQIRPLTSAAAD
jgi:hypothetical protein